MMTEIQGQPMGTKQRLRVVFIGMGASGINFAKQLRDRTENIELVIYEKNDHVGGTWYENRYPGCACDIPSVCYQFTWDKKPDWSYYYSGSDEIRDYLDHISDKHDLKRYVKFEHEIVKAEWISESGKWRFTIRNGDNILEDEAEFFINGGGVLNRWRWPEIEGLNAFKGKLMHTANWDRSYDLTGKRVLNIGIGSSGVQVIPTIIDKVQRLHVVAASNALGCPRSIKADNSTAIPRLDYERTWASAQGGNFAYNDAIKRRFRDDPNFYLSYCKAIESELNVRFKLIMNDTPEAIAAKKFSINEMRTKLQNREDLIDNLMPKDFNIGCRRPTPGNGFLEALIDPKVTVHFGTIEKIIERGFVDKNGKEHEVDAIVCATGFDTSFKPSFPILFDGINLQDQLTGDIKGYLGLSYPNIPNYFIFIGAYGPLGHGSVLPMVEHYTDYVIQVLEKTQREYIKRLSVKQSVANDFTNYADEFLKRTAWSGPCSSWFRNGKTANKPVLWPGSRIHYLSALKFPRFEHFDIEYTTGNSFSFLGNGFTTRELDGRDLTWYMGNLSGTDREPPLFKMGMEDGGGRFNAQEHREDGLTNGTSTEDSAPANVEEAGRTERYSNAQMATTVDLKQL